VLVVENPRATDAGPVDPALTSSTGLRTMHERAAALGGAGEAGPRGDIWQVRAHLPLRRGSVQGW